MRIDTPLMAAMGVMCSFLLHSGAFCECPSRRWDQLHHHEHRAYGTDSHARGGEQLAEGECECEGHVDPS